MKLTLVRCLIIAFFLGLGSFSGVAHGMEFFAKGAYSKTYNSSDSFTTRITATAGTAIKIFPRLRVDVRYTNISSLQNRLNIVTTTAVGTISDLKTVTEIASVGIDINILGDKSRFQPFILVGAGYIVDERSYFFNLSGETDAVFIQEPKSTEVTGNVGAGFKIILTSSMAFEVEVFAYGLDIDKPNPRVNIYGNVGIRFFL